MLANLDKDLLDSCWYCENGQDKPCGTCSSCWSVRIANWVIETKHNTATKYAEKCKDYDKLIMKKPVKERRIKDEQPKCPFEIQKT